MIGKPSHGMGLFTAMLSIAVSGSAREAHAAGASRTRKPVDKGVAVVEFFTSAWCGKCPPVETMLSKLVEEAREDDRPVYMLAFHVDYFDIEGRRDPFSSKAFTERQYVYVEAFGEDHAGTPHAIVNGVGGGFVPDEQEARDWIGQALAMPTKAKINIKLIAPPDEAAAATRRAGVPAMPKAAQARGHITATAAEPARPSRSAGSRPAEDVADLPEPVEVDCTLTGMVAGMLLNVALVERDLDVQVPYGTRRTQVKGNHVVRAFQTLPVKRPGKQRIILDPPAGWNPAKSSVVAYVQDPRRLGIGGAAAIEVAPAE